MVNLHAFAQKKKMEKIDAGAAPEGTAAPGEDLEGVAEAAQRGRGRRGKGRGRACGGSGSGAREAFACEAGRAEGGGASCGGVRACGAGRVRRGERGV